MTSQNETIRNLPALIPGQGGRTHRTEAPRIDAAYAAQALGAGGDRRGLKGGAPVLAAARNAYLAAQWSGPVDRRLQAGVIMAARI